MAKAVISSVLESLLGKYVDGLGGDSLQVGLWSGELTLQNLTLKPHALAELQLPVTIVKGSIRRVHVVVPWNQLGSASVQVAIEGVYALVTPNTKLPSTEEIRQGKRAQLERQELLRQHDRLAEAHNQDGEDESTFVSRLMTRIVDNLQITLRDVHLRYEDNVSNPDVPFACGLMIQSFTFHTTDAEGRDVFVDRTAKHERFLHKAATLAAFGVYWDRLPKGDKTALLQHRPNVDKAMGEMVHAMAHRREEKQSLVRDGKDPRLWIVRPCNLSVRVTKNETTDFSRAAKYTVHTELNGFACALSREQYEDMLFLDRAFAGRRAIEAHFLNARCRPFHRAKDRPRQWWDYAVRLVITKKVVVPGQTEPRKLKTVRMRFSSVKKSSQERKRYIEVFRMQLRKGSPLDPTTKEANAKATFEMTYPVDVVMALRNAAEDAEANARRQRIEKEKAQQAAAASGSDAAAQQASAGSWYGYFFGATAATTASTSTPLSPSAAAASKRTLADSVLSAEGRANLKKAYDEVVAQETSHEVPATCNLLSVKIRLRRGQLALYQTKQTAPFLVGSLDASLAVDVRPTNDWETRCRVQHFEVLNGLAHGTRFHTFCSLGQNSSASKDPCASLDVAYSTRQEAAVGNDDEEPTKVTAIRARFTMAPVRLMVDPAFVAFLQRFFVSMLPANQLDKVWSFATSSVSEWIFSEQDEEELYRHTVGRKTRMEFDVGVDFMAPVLVLTESITDAASPTVVVDLGRFQFKNEPLPATSERPTEQRLYWSTEMSRVNVLLGRLNALSALGESTQSEKGFEQVVEEFSIKFALNSCVSSPGSRPTDAMALLTPNISAKALLPRVVMKVSQDQIMALGRVHSSLQAQLFGHAYNFDDNVEATESDFVEQDATAVSYKSSSQITKHSKPVKDKYALQLALEIGEAVLHLEERSAKNAFRLRVTGTAFEMAMFTSQTIVQARLRALVMEDCLHDETSKFFHLLSTGEADASEDAQELIALDVAMFCANAGVFHPDREADTVVTLRCNVLHVQWNPSSIALLYQILSAYTTALQSHAIDISEPVVSAVLPSASGPQQTTSSDKPVFLARASLVQLSVTFNKDQFDRQLVRLAMEDASIEYVAKGSNEEERWNEVMGQLGNFVATDLSLDKHASYSPLVGLDAGGTHRLQHTSRPRRRTVSSALHPLLAFVYTWHDDASVQSVLKLDFEPVRVVYYHQQVMELVDYLFEGILGTMVAETLATATRLLLNEEASSTRFEVTAKKPTLILPIRLQDVAHWCLTADTLSLEHFPSSVIRYRGPSPSLVQRQRDVSLFASGEHISSIVEETSAEEISIRADCKRVRLTNATINCATSDSGGGVTYSSVLHTPTHLIVDVDDLVSAGTFSLQCRALPRLTVRVSMDEVAFELERWQYLAALALIEGNFGADLLVANSSRVSGQQIDQASRPAMVYSYSRTDLEVVTMQLIFEMAVVKCDLFQDPKSAMATDGLDIIDLVDHVVQHSSSTRQNRGLPLATLTGTQLSASINQLHDRWPSVVVRVDGFSLQDRATNCLRHLDGQHQDPKDPNGLIFHCQRPFEVSYAWHEESKQCKIDVTSDHLHGVVVPESILLLIDYLTVPSSGVLRSPPPVAPTMGRRKSLAEAIFTESASDDQDAYDLVVVLRGKDMSVAFPEDLFNAASEQIAMRADFSVQYKWKPSGPTRRANEQQASDSDLDIQSSLVIDGTGIEFFARNARRQGCASAAGAGSFSSSSSSAAGQLVQMIEPCDVHVEVSDLFPHAGQQQQIVAFKFSPIEVYASYEDSCVVMEVIDASTRSFERHAATSNRSSTAIAPSQLSGGSFEVSDETVVSMTEVHRYFTCDVGAMSLTLINDCDGCDMGLVQLQTQRCNLFLNVTNMPSSSAAAASPRTTLSGGGGLVTLISYYNPDTRDWHPMCSEWGLDVSVQGSIYDTRANPTSSENELHVIVTATHPLDLAVTHGLLEVVASAGGAWNRRSTQPVSPPPSPSPSSRTRPDRRRIAKAPSVIRNDTGLPLTFWLAASSSASSASHADASPTLTVVPSGDVADLHYVHSQGRGCGVARKYANRDRANRQGMRLHLHLADAPFQPIHGIEFEQLGSRAFSLLDARSGVSTNFTLNCHAQLVDGRIVVTVSSQIKVVSTLAMPLQLLVNDPTWASPVEVGILYPNRESAVPVMVSLGTELRVRPFADAVYGWSAPIPIQTRSEVDLRVESSSSEATKSAIFCVAMTLAQSLRVVRFAEPIVLNNKLPVELAFRVKSSLGGGAAATGGSSAASSRERMAVGGKSGVWWTDHRHRPQFELAILGCQTSRWIELTQATNMVSKSGSSTGDVVSVMLLRHDGRPFKLLLQIVEQAPAKSLHIFFYAEMWFINRTGLDLVFGNESEAESYFPPTSARTLVGNAQISAYSSSSESPTAGAPTVRLSMPSCGWSSRFTADPRRLSWQDECLALQATPGGRGGGSHGMNMLYEFGISADYATRHFGSITTLISVIPRYLVINQSPYTVLLLEDSSTAKSGAMFSGTGEAHHILAKGDVYALYWVSGARSRLRASVLGESTEFGWSEGVSFDQVKSRLVTIPEASRNGSRGGGGQAVSLQISVKQGSISQASMVIVISEAQSEDVGLFSDAEQLSERDSGVGWNVLTVHTQLAGLVVTIADKPAAAAGEDDNNGSLFGATSSSASDESVARLTITRVTAELSSNRRETSAKLNVMGIKVEDLLPRSKNPVVLRPVTRGDSFSTSKRDKGDTKCFLAITFLEKPHPKYRWIERVRIEVQDVRVATSMRFVDRLNKLSAETLAHFDSHAYATTLSVFDDAATDTGQREENILEYFVTTNDDDASAMAMASITGNKVYLESCEIAPVRVVVSFSREKGDVRNDPNAGFWLSNLKFKIDNAYLTLDAFKLSHAMATQEALVQSLSAFYVKSVKSQALGLIESVQVTTLVTSVVTSGVSSLVSTLMGKTDPSLANASQTFRYQFLTNSQLITKHSKLLSECTSTAQFLQQVKHLVYDWDSNHTGLEARGCVALGILNNSRQSLVINAKLNDGAEIRVLPVGRKHLASAMGGGGGGESWQSDRSMVVFAWGYTPTLLTSGDVYFTVQSNACNVFVTRKTARLKANIGYTATFTHQEVQPWWATNVVIVGDDLHGHVSSTGESSLVGDAPSTPTLPPVPMQPSQRHGMLDDEYEVVFSTPSLGLIAKQSGPRNVIVRECLTLGNGAPSPALACGQIAHGDTILTVSGVPVTNTTQFRDLVGASPRPVVLRFRRTGERFHANAAFDLFGEKQPRPPAQGGDDAFNLFG